MKYLLPVLLLVGCTSAQGTTKDGFWYEPCLDNALSQCGLEHLSFATTMSEKERETFICRVKALNSCRVRVTQ